MIEKPRHSQHDQVARAMLGWFRLPIEGMGYRSELKAFGTYWNTGMVYPNLAAEMARRLYNRLGFADEVYWRSQLILPRFVD